METKAGKELHLKLFWNVSKRCLRESIPRVTSGIYGHLQGIYREKVYGVNGSCDNGPPMKTIVTITLSSIVAAFLCVGSASGQQQTPSTGAQQLPATSTQQTTAPKTSTSTGTKSGSSTAAKRPIAKSAAPLKLDTDTDNNSNAIGMNIGKGLHRDSVDIDPAILLQGLKDAMAGGKTLMTDQEVQSTLMALQTAMR